MQRVLCLFLSLFLGPRLIAQPLPANLLLQDRPNLVLVLVIDQFRADYLTRFSSRFLPAGKDQAPGGMRYLMEHGAWYLHGQYDNLQNMTAPGHATILTGAYPYQAGIPTNYWYDAERRQPVYCTEDESMPLVGANSTKPHLGTSPRNLLATTVGDELKAAGYASRVVSISLKDRAAILMGGHSADLALWLDQQSMQWVSSRFYLPSGNLPTWVEGLNKAMKRRSGEAQDWTAVGPGSGLTTRDMLGKLSSITGTAFQPSFPHKMQRGSLATLASPIGIELTEGAAEAAVDALALGRRGSPDLLAVSFSSHDYVGHAFGPNSREIEEMTLAEDRSIAKLLTQLASKVPGGLGKVLIVLTADHGIPPSPEWMRQLRVDAGRIDEAKLSKDLEAHLVEAYGASEQGPWLLNATDLNFYLNKTAAAAKHLALSDLEERTKSFLLSHSEGLAYAFTRTDYQNGRLPQGLTEQQIRRTYRPGRSGDVVALLKPFYMLSEYGVDHMTGYSYDRTVPIILAGRHLHAGVYAERAGVVDIAPTLSFLLGLIPPSLSEGRVLSEALSP